MNRVLEYLEQKRQELEQLPFILFVQDRSIDPWQRLSFAPCLAPMTMGFADLMVYGLRDVDSKDPDQQTLNAHTVVDDQHWRYLLQDLETLGMNAPMNFSGALEQLWGKHCGQTRNLIYTTMALARGATPIIRLVTLEAIEVAADVGFSKFRQVGQEIAAKTGKKLIYFGQSHQDVEDEHEAMGAKSIRGLITAHTWTPEEEKVALRHVDQVSACFTAMGAELLAYLLKAREAGPFWPLNPPKAG
ncbi:hypothetical protein [Hyalangium rubrum]|uniref:Iron-containing redox enzyme family protein n=1 Tax=Hyalangium rubrum TaxID=3103134 RepID=A0ABU5GUC7_9BACT|nr:hypothetical protein [Hyalangium sp. s54d21]MDY7224780.1 hypothetical protein [Hyalangium sp. s54d21]